MISRTKIRVCLAAVVAAIGTLSAGVAPASAVTAGNCEMVDFGGFELLNPWPTVSPEIAIDIPAGEITVPEAVSTDGYPERVNVTQNSEIWDIEFLAADGSVIATSGTTEDLPDLVEEAEWVGSLGTVTLDEPAVAIRARHRPDIGGDGSLNSVHPTGVTICSVATPVEPPTDGECLLNEDGTPADPTDPDCTPVVPPSEPEPECPLNDDGTPVDPTDPDCGQDPLPPVEPEPECPLNDDGTPVDPTDPDCPTTPEPEPECPLNDDGTPVDPTDPDCPTTPEPLPPTQPSDPTPDPTLPVTGASSMVFALSGAWLLAAGATMVAYGRRRTSIS